MVVGLFQHNVKDVVLWDWVRMAGSNVLAGFHFLDVVVIVVVVSIRQAGIVWKD